MNSIDTTPRFEKKFDQDRVEKEPASCPPRPLNTLRTTKSAPVSSIPRESLLVRSPTSLLTSTVDHGLMDMWVDDGTNGNIDDTVRLLRFSTAASAIDGIFHSPRRNAQGSNPFKAEKPVNQDGNSQGPKKAREATEDVSSARQEAPSMIRKQPDILETGPVTPLRAEGNKLDEETDTSETPSPAKEASSEKDLPVFARKSLPAVGTEAERPPEIVEGKRLSEKGQEEGADNIEAAESPKADSSDGRASPKGGDRPKILNFFRRRSTVEPQIPVGVDSGSGRDTPSSNEQNEPATNKGPRKLKMLVKKLSSGLRERAGGEKKAATRPSGKAPTPTVTEAAFPPAGDVHAGTTDSCERPARDGTRSDLPAQQPASSGGSRNAILEQPTQSASGEQAQFTKGDRQLLQRLLKGFSSGSKDRTSESKGEGHAEVRQEAPNKGAFFAKLFRRKSTNAEEKESETGNTPCPEEGGTSDTPAFSAPPESQTRWSQLSQKVTRFLGMLVH